MRNGVRFADAVLLYAVGGGLSLCLLFARPVVEAAADGFGYGFVVIFVEGDEEIFFVLHFAGFAAFFAEVAFGVIVHVFGIERVVCVGVVVVVP